MLRKLIFLSLAISTAAWADLTIDSTSKPGVNSDKDRQTIYLKDDQMRIDQISTELQKGKPVDVVNTSMLIRFSGEPAGMLFIDHKARQVRVTTPLEAIEAEKTVDAKTDPTAPAPSVVDRNETREVMDHTAEGYDFSYNGSLDPMAMGGQQMPPQMAGMMKMKLHVTGTAWVVPGMAGADELAAFYAKMAKYQMTMGVVDPDQGGPGKEKSMVAPGLSHGLTDVMAQIAAKGFPLLTSIKSEVKMEMEGPMASMMQGMMQTPGGGFESESEVTKVSTAKVDPDLFYDGGIPDGYTLK